MGRKVPFFDFTRRLLRERLQQVEMGQTPTWTDIRHFFYVCRNKFLRENPDLNDIEYRGKDLYGDFQRIMKNWCKKQSPEYGIDPGLYWRFREKLNIWAEPRAVCDGESGSFLVDKDNREKVSYDCSFILVCEKKTVKRELLKALRDKGYKLNVVATGGNSSSDVQEAILSIKDSIEGGAENFYCLILHDYDVDGIRIFSTLKQRYSKVIDVGVNGKFINYLKSQGRFDPRLVEEQRLNKKYQHKLRNEIESGLLSEYTIDEFDYLQGNEPFEVSFNGKTKQTKTHWVGKRIEIDAIHVEYGIQPFIEYIMKKIREECLIWDLGRIGVTEHWLGEPENQYNIRLRKLQDKAESAYKNRMAITYRNNIFNKVIRVLLEAPEELIELIRKYWNFTYNPEQYYTTWNLPRSLSLYNLKTEELDKLNTEYADQRNREWLPDYEEQLDEINAQITNYEGDVRKGAEDLERQADALQEELDNAKADDEDLEPYEEKVEKINWGKEELEKIDAPDEAELIRNVIISLGERLEELEEDEI